MLVKPVCRLRCDDEAVEKNSKNAESLKWAKRTGGMSYVFAFLRIAAFGRKAMRHHAGDLGFSA